MLVDVLLRFGGSRVRAGSVTRVGYLRFHPAGSPCSLAHTQDQEAFGAHDNGDRYAAFPIDHLASLSSFQLHR
jgi:hypothetical protein